ncbi:MAG: extracellular solute-binding protein [Anaerovoracaceae bacterium]
MMNITKKRICTIVLLVTLVSGLCSCGTPDADPTVEKDILSQKIIEDGRTPITVLVKNAFSINGFEKAVEKKFPDIDIVQVGNYTRDMGIAEYEARMKNDDLTDIVMTWPVSAGEAYCADRLIDFSSLPISGKYTAPMLNDISKSGELYYLPGPSQVRGIVYNKTLFEENGWKVPNSFEGFISLCHTIEKKGIKALQLGLENEEVLDTAFVGYGYGDCFNKPENAQRIKEYNNGKGSLRDNFMPAFETFQKLIDQGILKTEDLEVDYSDREFMLFNRECAMVEDSVLMARLGDQRAGSKDEFALMPFFNPGINNDWARLYPVCYIGANKHLEETKNKDKYGLVMKILEYISTKEGQVALASDTGSMFSALKNVPPTEAPEAKNLVNALGHGRYGIFPTLKNAQSALRKGLAGMVAGKYTIDDVIKMTDKENLNPPVKMVPLVLGKAEKDFTIMETGNFVTDAMRKESGCEIALFLDNGKDGKCNCKGISGRLYKGDLTNVDILRILPDMIKNEKGELWKIKMTGKNLINTLEYAVKAFNNSDGWFYYFSGLKMEYDPTAKPGERIKEITDENGDKIDPKKLYSIAVMDETVPTKYIKSCKKTGKLIKDILINTISEEETISPSEDGRFTIGSH